MNRNTLNLNRRLFLRRRDTTIYGYLRHNAIIQSLLKRIDCETIYITSIYQLFKEKVDIQLIIMLLPFVATKVFPRFKVSVNLPNNLQNRLHVDSQLPFPMCLPCRPYSQASDSSS